LFSDSFEEDYTLKLILDKGLAGHDIKSFYK
jgi:hypothetical protein